jgi:hypothetical protein
MVLGSGSGPNGDWTKGDTFKHVIVGVIAMFIGMFIVTLIIMAITGVIYLIFGNNTGNAFASQMGGVGGLNRGLSGFTAYPNKGISYDPGLSFLSDKSGVRV